MKKFLALLLALMMVFSLAACGGSDSSEDDDVKANSSEKSSEKEKESLGKITFTETVVADNDEYRIVITDCEKDSYYDMVLNASIENKSSEKTYSFYLEGSSVNGVSSSAMIYEDVAPGKKCNAEIGISDYYFLENDIGDYSDIYLIFVIHEKDVYDSDAYMYEKVHIYPYGEENATKYVREAEADDEVIVDNEYIKATVIGYEEDDYGYSVQFFVENKTADYMYTRADDVSVNGYMLDPYFSVYLDADECAFGEMYWSNETLEDNNIDDITEIEFVFDVIDYESYDSVSEDSIILNP